MKKKSTFFSADESGVENASSEQFPIINKMVNAKYQYWLK